MADMFLKCCFAFSCTSTEMALLEEAFEASYNSTCAGNGDRPAPSAAFLTVFPPEDADDPWSGFASLFSDRDYPSLGADLTGSNRAGSQTVEAVISSDTSFDPEAVAKLIQRCCPTTLTAGPIGFEWCMSCSRQRIGEFGGGWCAIFTDRIEIETTGEALSIALEGGIL